MFLFSFQVRQIKTLGGKSQQKCPTNKKIPQRGKSSNDQTTNKILLRKLLKKKTNSEFFTSASWARMAQNEKTFAANERANLKLETRPETGFTGFALLSISLPDSELF